ncbi:NmrA family transcriptional regulator [Sinorhizobium americanum]|nr:MULTISPECIES: NmrA family NAD(P)-binding protein [Sinorhizobium]PDT50095.1 NmrA family transcriptional regulator [Sinorhizobium sp. NG07B]POH33744.1 NmrA family transcriptional regulator [Sinorhizobium americanum]
MFAVTGITGQVGGAVAEHLLATGQPVRAIVRNGERGERWRERGCEIAIVPDASDASALAEAINGTRGVFLMNPPNYDPEPNFPDTRRVAAAFVEALGQSRPDRAVFLSTVGAQVERFNLLNNGRIIERALRECAVPTALLRPAWFLENAAWDVPAARQGRIESYLQPLDHSIDMVAVDDIGRVTVELLGETWDGLRIVELRGPAKVSGRDIADAFGRALGRTIEASIVPRDSWEVRFRSQGMKHPEGRIAMLDGFNQDWIVFQGDGAEQRTGSTSLDDVVGALVARP